MSPLGARGDSVTYDVDLSDVGDFTGEVLRITADAGTSQLTASDLQFTFGRTPGLTPTSLPSGSGDASNFQWLATPTELRFERVGSDNAFVQWAAFGDSVEVSFTLGTGGNPHGTFYNDTDTGDLDEITFLAAGPLTIGLVVKRRRSASLNT